MEVIYILMPLAILLAAGALVAFMRAAAGGQFDDLDTPPYRMLHDDEADVPVPNPGTPSTPTPPPTTLA